MTPAPHDPPAGTSARAVHGTVTLLAFTAFFSGAALRICDALLPRLARDFDITAGAAGRVIIGFSVAYGLMQLFFGPLGDRYGKLRVMCFAAFGCAVGAMAAAFAPDMNLLVGARILWGMCAAGVIPVAMAWIGDNVPYDQRQATLARFLTGTLSGMTAGQLAGGLFADSAVGWRGAFFTLALGFAAVATLLVLRAPKQARPVRADGVPQRSFAGQLSAVLSVRWAHAVLLAVLAEGVFLLGPMAYLPAYIHHTHGVSLTAASAMLALYAVGGLVYAISARRIVARVGEQGMVASGGLLAGACFFAWWLSPPWMAAAPLALCLGFGTYLFHNTLQTHATQMAPAMRGTSVALFAFCLFTGQAIGVTASAWIVDNVGYPPMLLIAAVAMPLAGFGFMTALKRRLPPLAA